MLLMTALTNTNKMSRLRVCDLGTGSGAIGLALAQERDDVEVCT